eukprot:TRINITY_DN752_c0_g1_i2.p1 TRINITY_DN752_c0_g1~~TRINITY_DN752_c0_g1_i2.p1  ORF type:complete len:393 (+),score=91.76 TRINITY_DN752_c0_g1_i2:41-1219(+)
MTHAASLSLLCLVVSACYGAPTPSSLVSSMTSQIVANNGSFLGWQYGPAIIYDAMWMALERYPNLSYKNEINSNLDKYLTGSNYIGYKALHNISMPWDSAVGDHIGLFPIAYLARDAYNVKKGNTRNPDDLEVAKTIADRYIIQWPLRLSDGTFSRNAGWGGKSGGAAFVWCDDMFMGMALPARLSVITRDPKYIDSIGTMQLTYNKHLVDTTDNIYHHGYDAQDNQQSCCKWGRANGWTVMSHVEVLLSLKTFNDSAHQKTFAQVLDVFRAHAAGVAKLQAGTGAWHQILNETTTYLETSATAMFLLSFITGVQEGWLDKAQFDPVIQRAYSALANTVTSTGVVNGICVGTGVGTSVSFYEQRPTTYTQSSPGLGSVLKAIILYDQYTNAM